MRITKGRGSRKPRQTKYTELHGINMNLRAQTLRKHLFQQVPKTLTGDTLGLQKYEDAQAKLRKETQTYECFLGATQDPTCLRIKKHFRKYVISYALPSFL